MHARTTIWALLLGCSGALHAQAPAPAPAGVDRDTDGAYLSTEFGNGRAYGGNASGYRWMRGRAAEVRAGRREATLLGDGRIDFAYYNEGHPDNNHRDGFALQWVAVHPLGPCFIGELGLGPYLSMNTTTLAGHQRDDAHWGLLLSAAVQMPLDALPFPALPAGTHLRLGFNQALMREVHRSRALMLGIGRQFGAASPDPGTEPATGPWWLGVSYGNSNTNMAGTDSAHAAVLETRKYLGPHLEHWAVSGKFVFEGDDGARVDRRGIAGQLWYVQQVTPRFSIGAGAGPYATRNRRESGRENGGENGREENAPTRANLLVSFQAERALSRQTRVFINFNRVKTLRQTDDRDVFQFGLLKRFD
jgi:hypothetical protein